MRTLGTLVVLGGTVVLAYGCSAAGNAPIGTADETDASTTSPGDYGSAGDGGSSGTTPKKDSGLPSDDGGYVYDAGSPVAKAPEGSACDPTTALGDPQSTQGCGLCGTQTRACLGGGPDGGTFTWAAWGVCTGAVTSADACDPTKTYSATACGNCGTTPQVCGSDCHFETGFDCDEPVGACHPADTKFVLGASCSTAGQGRLYTCGSTCTFGSPSDCEVPPPNPNSLTISSTVGGSVTANFALTSTATTSKIDGTCPADIDTSDDPTPFIDIAIVNPTTRTVTVSLWDGPDGSGDLDTIMAWYPTPVFPPPDMTACTSANDDCFATTDCANTGSHSGWSSLAAGDSAPASIPAGGTITVYVGGYTATTTGNFTLHAKTEN
jgi:hypothetical protein